MKRHLSIEDTIAFIDTLPCDTGSVPPLNVCVARRGSTDRQFRIEPVDLGATRAVVSASADLWGDSPREILMGARMPPPVDGAAIHEALDQMEKVTGGAFALVPYNDGGVIYVGACRPVLRGLGQAAEWFEVDRLPMLRGGDPSVSSLLRFLRALISL